MTSTALNKLMNRSIFILPGILGLLLTGLVSACSGNQAPQPNLGHNDTTASPPAQNFMPSTGAPAANFSAPSQVVAASPSASASPSQDHIAGIGSATVVTVHGKIVSVDRKKKLVTLVGPRGKQVSLHVYNPYNLQAAKPGEPFVARFYEIVTIRKMRPGESIPAASVAEGVVSAAPGQIPGAVGGNQVQLVATIDVINDDKKTVVLKGPDGVVETVNVANPANLKLVKPGDQIVITLTNVVAISLDQESGV